LGELVELLDPGSLVIWTVDRGPHEAIAAAAALDQRDTRVVTGDAPPADTIIAFDLPDPARLRQLAGAGEVVLLVPPGAEGYVDRVAALPDIPATSRLYVGVGKKDGATVNDLVAVLTKELRLERSKIGRVELRDAFSLVEVPAQDAERIATALNGTTIRRRRVTARVDRGTPSRPPGPRGPGTMPRPRRPPGEKG
jgi:hypothetical protein